MATVVTLNKQIRREKRTISKLEAKLKKVSILEDKKKELLKTKASRVALQKKITSKKK